MATDIIIRISHDRLVVEIEAPAGLDLVRVEPRALAARLQEQKVVVDKVVAQNLAHFASEYAKKAGSGHRAVVARAVEAVKGEDSKIEWCAGYEPIGTGAPTGATKESENQKADYYQGKKYVAVKAGTVVGRVIPPTIGTPGRDVHGADILEAGAKCRVRFAESVNVDASGQITARIDGILIYDGERVAVTDQLTVPDYVDFSSGHIDFPGDVHVVGGVRTGFKVRAGKNLTIAGLVEICEIECEGDLTLNSGMAGKGKGTLQVRGHAKVGYLESVSGSVQETLSVERELGDCNLIVGSDLKGPNASVFGGEVAVTGSCVLKSLGSEAGTATRIVLGDVPLLQMSKREIARALEEIDGKLRGLEEQERLTKLNPRPSASEKERLTEFAYERSELQRERKPKAEALEEIERIFSTKRRLDVQINRIIHRNVTLVIGEYTAVFRSEVRGPVSIFWDVNQHLLCRIGSGEPRPLNTIASVQRHVGTAPTAKAACGRSEASDTNPT